MSPILQKNVELAPLTAFRAGGPAEKYLRLDSADGLRARLSELEKQPPDWLLGSGTNILISDSGLPGLTLHFQGGGISLERKNLVIADSGASWDDVVLFALRHGLWGIELMSGIPGSLGGAVAININAYGQALVDRLCWVEVFDPRGGLRKVDIDPSKWGYKKSPFAGGRQIIVSAALELEEKPTCELRYAKALDYARKAGLDPAQLEGRREIILGARAAAGALLDDSPAGRAKTCGSFFRNPVVAPERVEPLLAYEESHLKAEELLEMNRLHGGQARRVSATHVLLAAGFRRGQEFGRVRLHPDHVLKIENWRGASAQEIYGTAELIRKAVFEKLAIRLEFEVQTLGDFLTGADAV